MPIKPRESLPYSFARFTQTLKRLGNPVARRLRNGLLPKDDEQRAAELQIRFQHEIPIFVYQMGKVGSTSIYRSLKKSYGGTVLHGHYFDAYHSNFELRQLHAWYSQQSAPKIKLISLIREPVTRNISAFFQNFKRDTGMEIEKCQKSMHELRDMFLTNYPHEIPWVWFDNNIKKNFGIDVYEYPFGEQGHLIIKQENIELLLLRCDLPDSRKSELVGDFVGLKSFSIANANVSAEKEYSQYMDAFKSIKLPLWYLHRLSATKYMKHFYRDEIGPMIQTWTETEQSSAQI